MSKTKIVGRASSEASKLDIIMRLGKIWLASPDLRLGQLIWNALNYNQNRGESDKDVDFFYFEDDKIIDIIEKFYGK